MTLYKTIADKNGGTQVAMTAQEESDFLSSQSSAQSAMATANTIAQAKELLAASDITMLRVIDAVAQGKTTLSAQDVIAYSQYRSALRPIAKTGVGTIPPEPTKPAGS